MPYSNSHYYMPALLLVTVFAFWPSYFGQLSSAPWIHHIHGVTGTLWILLIATQSYMIDTRKIDLHRRFGKLLFVRQIAKLSPVMVFAFGIVLGLLATILGWRHGLRR